MTDSESFINSVMNYLPGSNSLNSEYENSDTLIVMPEPYCII